MDTVAPPGPPQRVAPHIVALQEKVRRRRRRQRESSGVEIESREGIPW